MSSRVWKHRTGEFILGKRTLLMGIVNVTPDSFSDGGKYFDVESAVEHAKRLQEEGADLLDLGAESTRPGSESVSPSEQIHRLLPVIERLISNLQIPISVDTTSATVAKICLGAGASIVNDISAFEEDSSMAEICAQNDAGVVLMHRRGIPKTMQQDTHYEDLFGEIYEALARQVKSAKTAGIPCENIIVDPGIGFGKSFEQNYRLLGSLRKFANLSAGVLVGPSRKAFTGEFNKLPASERQFSTAATVALAIQHGADIVRVHDVKEMRQVADIIDRFKEVHERDRG